MYYFKRNEQKTCFFCHSKQAKKNDKVGSIQRYKCKDCGKQFRGVKRIDVEQLNEDYVFGYQSVNRLAAKYNVSSSTIRRKLESIRSTRIISSDKRVVVLMGTTYWGWKFGVVVFKDACTAKILWRKFIFKRETLTDYQEGVDWLLVNGFRIDGVVCDGLRGMFAMLSKYNVQMCQFHQVKIIKKYLTSKPDIEASKELLSIAKFMHKTDKESFVGLFEEWAARWSDFLKERTKDNKTGKTHYTHSKLRSAYLSLKRNMPYLWTSYGQSRFGRHSEHEQWFGG